MQVSAVAVCGGATGNANVPWGREGAFGQVSFAPNAGIDLTPQIPDFKEQREISLLQWNVDA